MSPLLVNVFTEKAIDALRRGDTVDDLPKSFPALYDSYVKGLNPKGEDIDRAVSDERFLQAAEILARLSTAQDFVPRNFSVG